MRHLPSLIPDKVSASFFTLSRSKNNPGPLGVFTENAVNRSQNGSGDVAHPATATRLRNKSACFVFEFNGPPTYLPPGVLD